MSVIASIRIAVVALAALSLAACGINSVPAAEENAKARWADVQSAYQRRADLIPNLVASVRGAAASESQILTEVTDARARATSINITTEDLSNPEEFRRFQDAQNELTQALGQLRTVVENYPQLQSQARFADLMTALEGSENQINVARVRYNEAVQAYNTDDPHLPATSSARGSSTAPSRWCRSRRAPPRRPRRRSTSTTSARSRLPGAGERQRRPGRNARGRRQLSGRLGAPVLRLAGPAGRASRRASSRPATVPAPPRGAGVRRGEHHPRHRRTAPRCPIARVQPAHRARAGRRHRAEPRGRDDRAVRGATVRGLGHRRGGKRRRAADAGRAERTPGAHRGRVRPTPVRHRHPFGPDHPRPDYSPVQAGQLRRRHQRRGRGADHPARPRSGRCQGDRRGGGRRRTPGWQRPGRLPARVLHLARCDVLLLLRAADALADARRPPLPPRQRRGRRGWQRDPVERDQRGDEQRPRVRQRLGWRRRWRLRRRRRRRFRGFGGGMSGGGGASGSW